MTGQEDKQAGFSIVEAVVVVAVLAVVGAAGWFVYQHNRTQLTNAEGSNQTAKQQGSSSTQAGPTVAYLTISEWGLKLPLSSTISDAYYAPSTGAAKGTDGQPNEFLLGLKTLDGSSCAATNTTAIAMIFRFLPTETDGVTGKLLTQLYPNAVKMGSYYYAYEKLNNGTCSASQSTLQTVDSAFTAAQKGIVAASTASN